MIDVESITNQIINADCMDILKQLPDKCIDLVLTDPPYGIYDYIANSGGRKNISKGNKFAIKYKEKTWDKEKPPKEIFDEIFRVSKNQIICGGNFFTDYLPPSRCWVIWDKLGDKLSNVNNELIWTSFDKSIKMFRRCHGLDKGFMVKGVDEVIHPTQKPIKLFEFLLQSFSAENDLILDCFSGSGTTAVACHNLKRRFICIEKDKDYFDASVERLKNTQAQMKLF